MLVMPVSPRRCMREAFADLESLESGQAREYIGADLLSAFSPASRGQACFSRLF